jgi:anaerobic selenocysteine-containing dehydrogenase
MNHLGQALTAYQHPPVKMLFVYNANPAATVPNQNLVLKGLEREDLFTVVFDQVMTDTALYADIVLPATTFLESYDFAKAYGPISLQLVKPVIEPVGESRSNPDVFSELGAALGLDRPGEASGELELMLGILDDLPGAMGRDLREDRRGLAEAGDAPVQFVDVFPPTSDGRIHLCPPELEREAPEGLYAFQPDPATERCPLALISPSSDRTINSTLGELPRPDARLQIHPADAAARGLGDGEMVRVFNELGEVRCPLSVTSAVRSGTVSLPKGLWRRSTANGCTGTALVPDSLTDLGAGACFNDARVQVAAVPSA